MSSSRNNNSTGLRFLWIPGKKKHQHKGRYDTTNKGNVHSSSHHQRKQEPWSLGGSRAHNDLLKSMFFVKYGPRGDIIGESSGLTSLVPSSLGAVGASATLAHSSSHSNGNAPTDSVDLELEHDLHNASTLLASEKRNGVRKKNLDSIERFDDHNSDDVDATKLSYLDLPKVPFHPSTDEVRQPQNNGSKNDGTKKNDDEDCTVKCLYYALLCCECTIS